MGISITRTPDNTALIQNRIAEQQTAGRQSKTTGQQAAAMQSSAAQSAGTRQKTASQPVDVVSKNIQNEISEVQRQKQGLTTKQEMSEAERSKKKQELQQELNSLNTRLRQRQAEVSRERKKEERLEELTAPDTDMQKGRPEETGAEKAAPGSEAEINLEKISSTEARDPKSADEKVNDIEDTGHSIEDDRNEGQKNLGVPQDKMQSIVAGDIFKEQAERREAVIARIEGGIAILKGEIRQDEMRGEDVEHKKAELKSREAKVRNTADGLPDVNVPPRQKPGEVFRNAVRAKSGAEDAVKSGVVREYPDGIVIIT